MPAMHYRLRWPDQTETECYSPSLVIRDYFELGTAYGVPEFLTRVREATGIASARVAARYGFPCSRALAQLQTIETAAARFAADDAARMIVLSFDDEH